VIRKPDVIQSLVFLFAGGLVVSAVTQLSPWQAGPSQFESVQSATGDSNSTLQAEHRDSLAWKESHVWAFNTSPNR